MTGLIPLMLRPVAGPSRQSIIFPTTSNPPSPTKIVFAKENQPPSTTPALPALSKPLPALPTESTKPTKPKQEKPVVKKRVSIQVPVHLPVLPYTAAEWSKAVAEVKRQYLNRRYRPCSVRCGEILDNIKYPAAVEPAYLIYLHFYAAASLEMSARPLQANSPYRNNLLRQARTHYQQAAELIQSEDLSMKRFSRHSSTTNSSSMHSPACSVSSRAWTESTGFSSPTPSIASLEEEIERMAQETTPRKKRVTFSDEPIIRPDSPTLGFDDWLGRSSPDSIPKPALVPEVVDEESLAVVHDVDDGLFLRDQSVHRYTSVLSSLRSQVTSHLDSVEAQLARPACDSPTSGRSTPEVPSDNGELRSLELRARIERLRQNGWQRKRFDPSRYAALREQVLAELA